nr:unnamed protein product [Callosobruchus analis]
MAKLDKSWYAKVGTQKMISLIECFSLSQLVNQPTRITATSQKLLDLIIISDKMKSRCIKVNDCSLISDHCLVSCEIECNVDKFAPFEYTYRDFSRFSNNNFTADLQNLDLYTIYSFQNVNDKVRYLNNTLLKLFNKQAPVHTVRITKKKAPWLTDTIKIMQRKRDQALVKYRASKAVADFHYYKLLRNEVNYAIVRGKKAYLQFQLNNKSNIWKELRDFGIHNKNNTLIPDELADQSEWQTVNRRKNQKPRQSLVVGNKDCEKIKGVPKYVDLHVSRISPETSKEDLYQLLKEEFPEIKCETLNSKNPGIYSSFKTSEDNTEQCLVFDPNLLLLNINTMSVNKIDMLCTDISTYKDLYFLCLVEIGVKSNSVDNFYIEGYYLATFYCRPQHCGGVAIWVKSFIISEPVNLNHFCIEQSFEVCALSVSFGQNKYIILNCYRSPSAHVDIFMDRLTDVLQFLYRPYINIIVCGDFNLDSLKNTTHISLYNLLSCYHCRPLIGWPTRFSLIGNGCCCVLDNNISDHRTILIELDLNITTNNNKTSFKRSFSDENIKTFRHYLEAEDWLQVFSSSNFQQAFQSFHSSVLYCFEISFPKRKSFVKRDKKNWINNDVIRSSRYLKDLFYPPMNKPKGNIAISLKGQKNGFYRERIMSSSHNTKYLWKVVSELTQKNTSKGICSITVDNKTIKDPKEMAKAFNKFFVAAPLDLIHKIKKSCNPLGNTGILDILE